MYTHAQWCQTVETDTVFVRSLYSDIITAHTHIHSVILFVYT